MDYEYKGSNIPTKQNSLAGGGIDEEELLRQKKKETLRKKYRTMTVALVGIIVVSVVLLLIRYHVGPKKQLQLPSLTLFRPTVERVIPSMENLENNLLDGYSLVGCYEVSAKLPTSRESTVEFDVGEIYNNHVIHVSGNDGELSHTAVVSDGKVTVHVEPKGVFLLQIETEATEGLSWSDWTTELPEGSAMESHAVQTDIMYRTREREFTTFGKDVLAGWELYDTFIPESTYGEWSDWAETALIADEYHEVEEQKQYRSRKKEFSSSNYPQLEGWTSSGSETNYTYGDWIGWVDTPVAANSSTEVDTQTVYDYVLAVYIDGMYSHSETYQYFTNPGVPAGSVLDEGDVGGEYWVFYVSSVTEKEIYRYRTKTVSSVTYYFYRWSDWSDWGSETATATDSVEVEERTLYRIRDIYGDVGYRFRKWSDWSDWTLEKLTEGEDTEVDRCVAFRFIGQNELPEDRLSTEAGTNESEPEDWCAEVDALILKADTLAAQYHYDEAILLLKEAKAYAPQSQTIEDKIAAYEDQKSQLTVFSDILSIPNISFNVLIADPERAFADERLGEKYAKNFITVSEFEKILEQLYANDYILVNLEDLVQLNAESGALETCQLMLPSGKKPIMLTEAIVNYFEYMIDGDGDGFADAGGDGFASRLVVRNGEIEAEYVDALGNVQIGKFDFVPILEDFIKRHPDFSYRGARATLAVTGLEGVFGYRVNPSYINTMGQEYVDDQIAQAKELIQLLREKGYNIACNSYGNVDYRYKSAAQIQADIYCWEKEILPVLGDVDTLVFARRSGIDDYTGSKLVVILDAGFRHLISEGTSVQNHIKSSYFHQNKLTIRGEMLCNQPELLSPFFDAAKVLSDQR